MNKKTAILVILLSLISSQSLFSQNSQGFTIKGKIKELPDQTKLYLITEEEDTVANCISHGDSFAFTGNLSQEGRYHFVRMDTSITKIGSKGLFLINAPISIYTSMEVWPSWTKVEGSKPHDESQALTKLLREASLKSAPYVKMYSSTVIALNKAKANGDTATINKLSSDLKSLEISRQEPLREAKRYIKKNNSSIYIPYFIYTNMGLFQSDGSIQAIYDGLATEAKESYYGQLLKKGFELKKMAAYIKEGSIIPNFSFLTIDGNQLAINDVLSKGKITLIDFWASWCKPCRAQIPSLNKVYEAFHNKGFNILSISSDKSLVAWKKALEEDNTPWYHGIQKTDSPISRDIFGVRAIPSFILVNNRGELIAFNSPMSAIPSFGGDILDMTGNGLYNKVKELLDR